MSSRPFSISCFPLRLARKAAWDRNRPAPPENDGIPSVSRRAFGLLALAVLAGSGCGHSARNLSLDPDLARKSCTELLDTWKGGKTLKDLPAGITARDEDWEGGAQLVAYELLPGEMSDGTNLHIPVRLTLKKPKGKEAKADVTYIVGTSPVVTVFRQ